MNAEVQGETAATGAVAADGAAEASAAASEPAAESAAAAAEGVSSKPRKKRKPYKKRSKRNDVIVTARVPMEIRAQANVILEEIGSSTTELVNAAYRYVLEKGELPPLDSTLERYTGQTREIPPEVSERTRQRMEQTSFEVPSSYWDEASDAQRVADAVRGSYEPVA